MKAKKPKLRKTLDSLGLSGNQAAKELGISRRQLTRYLSGEYPVPRAIELALSALAK